MLMNDMVKRWQENGDDGEVAEEEEKEKEGVNGEELKQVESGAVNKRNGSEIAVETIKEENEEAEQDVGDKDVKDDDGDVKIE